MKRRTEVIFKSPKYNNITWIEVLANVNPNNKITGTNVVICQGDDDDPSVIYLSKSEADFIFNQFYSAMTFAENKKNTTFSESC